MQVPYQSSSRPPTPTYGSQAEHSSSPVESSGFVGAYGTGVSASPVESGTFFGAYGAGFSSSPVDSASPMSATQRNMHEVEHEESKDSSPDEEIRKGRTNWTKKENERLISSWIKNSVDAIEGNGKRGDYYWKQVAEEYNKNSPANKIRSVAQCKGHWSKTTPLVSLFHACYIKTKNVYASGQSEEGLMEKTRAMYLTAAKVKRPFALEYWWRVVKEEPKWRNLYMEEDLGGRRHKLDASGAYTSSSAADSEGTDRVREPCPQGTKAAKEARKLKGKVKAKAKDIPDFVPFHISEESYELLREGHGRKAAALEKWAEATTAKAGADKEMAEAKKEMAKARKERTKVDIFNTYMELLKVDTSGFNDAQMQRHEKMVENLCNKLD
ncbi:uncharacterized protein LOC104584360 [Brachypodium distachyon]|nr:uncharacterized protein LOC104584360 [Brachypodium distachyon]|eukprot:XP_010237095.2 uncharacterized protein LOC104584360 [Brachypodium distachyon]